MSSDSDHFTFFLQPFYQFWTSLLTLSIDLFSYIFLKSGDLDDQGVCIFKKSTVTRDVYSLVLSCRTPLAYWSITKRRWHWKFSPLPADSRLFGRTSFLHKRLIFSYNIGGRGMLMTWSRQLNEAFHGILIQYYQNYCKNLQMFKSDACKNNTY